MFFAVLLFMIHIPDSVDYGMSDLRTGLLEVIDRCLASRTTINRRSVNHAPQVEGKGEKAKERRDLRPACLAITSKHHHKDVLMRL